MDIIEDAIKTENDFMKFVNELSIAPDEGDHRPTTVRNLFIIIWARNFATFLCDKIATKMHFTEF